MMNKDVQNKILEIAKEAEDELRGPPVNDFYKDTLYIILNSEDWYVALNKIKGHTASLINARRRQDAKERARKVS